ncbi:MAG: hypothetical protein V3U93_03490 [Alphaproteobacteria bacterium]
MQRAILDEFGVAPGEKPVSSHVRALLASEGVTPEPIPWWAISDWRIADDIRDMRKVSKTLARRHGGISHMDFAKLSWQAAFSRAVRGLVKRGLIETISVVPLAEGRPDAANVHELSDGMYLVVRGRQRRYTRIPQYT